MKFEQEINNLESQNFNGDYILLKGSKPILFTAPHTMIQIRENGDIKLNEPYTKALALYFHKHFDTYALIKLNDTGLDSNRDNHDEFKEVMYKLVKEEKIKLVLDLHGAKNSHDFDVEFGTLNNLTADFSTIKELEEAFKENNITNIEHNNPFKGGAITQYLYNIKDVDVIQLEINAKFRDRHNLNKLYSLVCSLTNFIKQYSEYTNLRTSNNLSLFIPNIEDYWYLKKIQEDPKTMSYNAGYDVNYLGYDYDTGCIELKESSWEDEFNKKKDKGIFLAYIKDEELKDYTRDKDPNKYRVQRYKGLGEMDPEPLRITTMSPETRNLIKVNITDAAMAEKRVSVLMGDSVEPRKEWIDENVDFSLEDDFRK